MNVMTNMTQLARAPGDPQVLKSGPSSLGGAARLAHVLGWISYGLGIAELMAAPRIVKALGLEAHERLVRGYGIREMGAGMLSLSFDAKIGIASRIAGDAVDLVTLATAKGGDDRQKANRKTALAVVAGITALDILCFAALQKRLGRGDSVSFDYSDRSGFPMGVEAARGAARDFETPLEFRASPQLAAVSDSSDSAGARDRPSLPA